MEKDSNIGKHSRITLAVAIAAIVICGSGVFEWANLKSDVRQISHDQWTVNDELRWTSEMQKLNPSLNVPIPTLPAVAKVSTKTNSVIAAAMK